MPVWETLINKLISSLSYQFPAICIETDTNEIQSYHIQVNWDYDSQNL